MHFRRLKPCLIAFLGATLAIISCTTGEREGHERIPYTITGTITELDSGGALGGITVVFLGEGAPGAVTTDWDGVYQQTSFSAGTVTVAPSGDYEFIYQDPDTGASLSVAPVEIDIPVDAPNNTVQVDFVAAPTGAAIGLLAPNGEEELPVGGVFDIKWSATGLGGKTVDLEYWDDNNQKWVEIAAGVSCVEGANSHLWTLPGEEIASCLVRVTCVELPAFTDESDAPFAIQIQAIEPTVTIAASLPNASEAGPVQGKFTVTRAGNVSGNLTVNVLVGGTATEGADYATIGSAVTILDGSTSRVVMITPVDDTDVEVDETVTVALVSGTGYTVAFPDTATVTIADNDTDPDLLLWYRFDETSGLTAADSSGNANDGTLTGMSGTEWSAGQINGALSFDGTDDEVNSASAIGISGAQARTISFWAYANDTADAGLVGWGLAPSGQAFNAIIRLGFWALYDNGTGNWDTGVSVVKSVWTHHALTYDGAVLCWYMDGVLVGSNTFTYDTADTTVGIGWFDDAGNRYFNGVIDDVRVYARTLDPSEVEGLFSGASGDPELAANESAAVDALCEYYSAQAEFHTVDFYDAAELQYASPWANWNGDTPQGYVDLYELQPSGTQLELISPEFRDASWDWGATPLAGYCFDDIEMNTSAMQYDARYEHGICATPASYGVTGRSIFVIGSDGSIYEKDAKQEFPTISPGDPVMPLTTFPDVAMGGWTYTTQAAVVKSERMLNEEATIEALQDYLDAQGEFKTTDFYATGNNIYANPIWGVGFPDLNELGGPGGGGTILNLISVPFASATMVGTPFNGFVFDDISADVVMGAYDYTLEHGLCGVPDAYALSGWNEFLIDVTGAIYKKHARALEALSKGQRPTPLTTYPDVAAGGWILVIPGAGDIPGNEAAVVEAMCEYYSAQAEFRTVDFYALGYLTNANPTDGVGFPDLYELGGPGSGGEVLGLIGREFANATPAGTPRAGYVFDDITADAAAGAYAFSIDHGISAAPLDFNRTGRNIFVMDSDGNIYKQLGFAAVVPPTTYPDVGGGWMYVTTAQVVKSERMLNEEATIQALVDYCGAQPEFKTTDHYGLGRFVYANPTDGVGFPDLNELGGPGSGGTVLNLISLPFACATAAGSTPFNGFVFDDISADVVMGAYDYQFDHGLGAAPKQYARNGWNVFVVDRTGDIYKQKGTVACVPPTVYPNPTGGWILVIPGAGDIPGNEAAAVEAMCKYYSAQAEFRTVDFYALGYLTNANPTDGVGFPDLYELGGPGAGGTVLKLIDLMFASATPAGTPRAGYLFDDITADIAAGAYDFQFDHGLGAAPAQFGRTGRNIFVMDSEGNIYKQLAAGDGPPVTTYPDVTAGWTYVTTAQVVKSERMLNEEATIQALLNYRSAQFQFRNTDWYGISEDVYANRTNGVGYADLYQLNYPGAGTAVDLIGQAFADASVWVGGAALSGFRFDDLIDDVFSGPYDYHFEHGLCAAPGAYAWSGWNLFVIDNGGAIYKRHAQAVQALNEGDQATPLTQYPDIATGWLLVQEGVVEVYISASVAAASEPATPGEFTVTRTGSTSGDLVVDILVGGTADEGTDYTAIGATVMIPDGAASQTIAVTPVDDVAIEGDETVIIAILSGTGYDLGSPSNASVTIADDD